MISLLLFVLGSSLAIDLAHVGKLGNKFKMTSVNKTRNITFHSLLHQELCSPPCLSETIDCTDQVSTPYRTVTGQCNNVDNPFWGSNNIEFLRPVGKRLPVFSGYPPQFTDPRSNNALPNARLVSTTLSTDHDSTNARYTHLVMHLGQFIDHDVTLTPEGPNCDSECPQLHQDCCEYIDHDESEIPSVCWPIVNNNSTGTGARCLDFQRSSVLACEVEGIQEDEQFNAITAFLDGGNVYSSDPATNAALRSNELGLLKENDKEGLLPFVTRTEVPASCPASEDLGPPIFEEFVAGDVRANEIPGLTSLHTLWMREHNRIADMLQRRGFSNDDEELYQEARRLLQAEYQAIVYNEWLPIVLGDDIYNTLNLSLSSRTTYDPSIRPGITQAFASAAFRFGHTLVSGTIELYDNVNQVKTGTRQLRNNFFNTEIILTEDLNVDKILSGMFDQAAENFNTLMSEDLTDFLFTDGLGDGLGMDLFARNIQRGRDHALGSYSMYRDDCGLGSLAGIDFSMATPAGMMDDAWQNLGKIYASPMDIELWAGGLSERPVGGVVGQTFGCIIGSQFAALRSGDRYFFSHENSVAYSESEYQLANARTMRDVLCDNVEGIVRAQPNVFFQATAENPIGMCDVGANAYP